jgi:Prokaryotic RING finger family 1
MGCVLAGLILIGSVLVFAIASTARAGSGRWNEALAHVARRFHGVLQRGGWLGAPSVWIRHGEAQGRLSVNSLRGGGSERCVQMSMQQRDLRGRCEIFSPAARPALWPALRGMAPLEFDWEGSGRPWHVFASEGDEVRHLLSDGVRLAIEMLGRQPLSQELAISLSPGWMVVRQIWHTPRGLDLEAFVERVSALSDQLNLAAAVGIQFVAGETPQLLETARCGVCGDHLTDEIVVCRRCNTPHHRDCWQYNTGCATYGCGGRECQVPGVAPLVASLDEQPATQAERPLKPR